MNRSELWKNFRLGEELDVSGTFIYNGLRRFHTLKTLDFSADLFEVLYQLSIGIERLMKVAIVLLEHDEADDQESFERSLVTHSHQALLTRIQKHSDLKLSNADRAFLHLLTQFYEHLRYDRFSLRSPLVLGKEKHLLFDFLEAQLKADFKDRNSIFGHGNTDQYRRFVQKIVTRIAGALFQVVRVRAAALRLNTDELRSASKAETVFLGKADIPAEEILWKELLIFFMNTSEVSGYLKFLRGIKPLGFDPALVGDYLDCFQSEAARAEVVDELDHLYEEEVPDKKTRLEMMGVIGSPNVYFDDDENGIDDDEIEESKAWGVSGAGAPGYLPLGGVLAFSFCAFGASR